MQFTESGTPVKLKKKKKKTSLHPQNFKYGFILVCILYGFAANDNNLVKAGFKEHLNFP